jgi:hypothetical protein
MTFSSIFDEGESEAIKIEKESKFYFCDQLQSRLQHEFIRFLLIENTNSLMKEVIIIKKIEITFSFRYTT